MTQLPNRMEAVHRLLNCAYAEFNAPDYVGHFMAQRAADLSRVLSNATLPGFNTEKMDIDAIFDSVRAKTIQFADKPKQVGRGFATRDLLGFALHRLTHAGMLETPIAEILGILQKRFEVNHRLFARYGAFIRKSGDDYADMQVYAMFSVVFFKLFRLSRHFNYLNTALKIDDLIFKSGWPIDRDALPLVCAAAALEQKIIRSEFEKHGF